MELGLLYIPASILKMQKQQQVIIQPLGVSEKPYIYSFERLNSESITYVSVGASPAYKYELTSSDELRTFWPRFVNGVDGFGSIFDQKTAKKMVDGAEVQVGKVYYLLCSKHLNRNYPSIEARRLCEKKCFMVHGIYMRFKQRLSKKTQRGFFGIFVAG